LAKNLKLNIKNQQLAKAVQRSKGADEAKPVARKPRAAPAEPVSEAPKEVERVAPQVAAERPAVRERIEAQPAGEAAAREVGSAPQHTTSTPRESADRPAYTRPAGERPPYQPREGSARPPYQPREGGRPPYRSSEGGERPPYRPREGGDRPPYRPREGGEKPYGAREGGDRPPYRAAGDRPPYRPREGGDRPFRSREGGDRPPYRPREGGEGYRPREGGDRPPYRAAGDRPPYRPREGSDRPPYRPREAGDRPPFRPREGGEGGERPPYRPREGAREWQNRPPREGASAEGTGYERRAPRAGMYRPGGGRRFGADEGPRPPFVPREKLGPTGRHVNDLLRPRPPAGPRPGGWGGPGAGRPSGPRGAPGAAPDRGGRATEGERRIGPDEARRRRGPVKEFRDVKPLKRKEDRGRAGAGEDDEAWRRRRGGKRPRDEASAAPVIRPTELAVRLPTTVKELAAQMKVKAAELVAKLFLQGMAVTLNDLLTDEIVVQLLGEEFGCQITIDRAEEERIRITEKKIREEIANTDAALLERRAPVVTFMGHVDHGKTSLIDSIRKSNLAAGEAGAITQHIGAFKCSTSHGDVTIIDTPGHEAFVAMRSRGVEVTDLVVLVIAGDEGMQQQTLEALSQAKRGEVTIVVAINKCDKPAFDAEKVYRQMAEQDLLPEAWGGKTVTVNTSAVTGQGIEDLLEMIALQSDVLELKANPHGRARGSVLESEMEKGLGSVATVLVQNGTLRQGDPLVFDRYWGRVKTMHDERGRTLALAGPSTPVRITGLSGLPQAGEEFIVVANEKEAKEIAQARAEELQAKALVGGRRAAAAEMLSAASPEKKQLRLVVRSDVQGTLEALKTALLNIRSEKVAVDIVASGVGDITESDVEMAAVSQAAIVGFHTRVESRAEELLKQMQVKLLLHDIIYRAIDEVKELMAGLLEKVPIEEDRGTAVVKALFQSSQLGVIAGCGVTDGTITRNNRVRVVRDGQLVWTGGIASLKRNKDDVREVKKGLECGILLDGFTEVKEGDQIQAFEITYIAQPL
jgi:translation initiation factor IF-2